MNGARNDTSPNMVTVLAIGVVCFILANVLHEALGHGGACLVVGGSAAQLSSAHFQCTLAGEFGWQGRVVAAAGTIVNFAAAFLFWIAFRASKRLDAARYFLWLATCTNYFVAAGYPLFSGVMGIGDWVAVVEGWPLTWLWRTALIAVGAILYFWIGIPFALRTLLPLLGGGARHKLAFQLTTLPYLTGATAASIGALFNPIGSFVVFTSAAASFGGNSALAWMTRLLNEKKYPATTDAVVAIDRSWAWIAFATILVILHVAVLGPGLDFN